MFIFYLDKQYCWFLQGLLIRKLEQVSGAMDLIYQFLSEEQKWLNILVVESLSLEGSMMLTNQTS